VRPFGLPWLWLLVLLDNALTLLAVSPIPNCPGAILKLQAKNVSTHQGQSHPFGWLHTISDAITYAHTHSYIHSDVDHPAARISAHDNQKHTHPLTAAVLPAHATCQLLTAAAAFSVVLLLLVLLSSAAAAAPAADEARRCLSAPLFEPRLRLLLAAAASVKYLRIS
jgi:hypothetical protein